MPDYTNWPLEADVLNSLTGPGITLRGNSGYQTLRIAQITAEVLGDVNKQTTRQFIPDSVPITKFYDGTGTASIEVDEYVELDGVAAIGLNADPGYPLANVIPYFETGKPWRRIIRGQGGLPAFQVAAVYQPVPTIFPAGRQNIAVTARWGYGIPVGNEVANEVTGDDGSITISMAWSGMPVDVWGAVCNEIARKVGNEAIFDSNGGLVVSWSEGDEKTQYAAGGLNSLGWNKTYLKMIEDYRRRAGRKIRQLRVPMM
jgi:hypothetical protein